MKKILLVLLLCTAFKAWSEVETGKPFPSYDLVDQFGTPHTLADDARYVFISSEKSISGSIADWLKTKDKDYLTNLKAEYVSDITPMPAIITKMFALPKMKKYPFTVYLADDKEFEKTYPAQKKKIAFFELGEGHEVKAIHFLDKPEELEAFFEPGKSQ